MKTIEITVNEQKKKSRIRKEIYGQFAEHLGRGIYEGLLSVRSPEFRMKTGFARMLRMRFVKSRFR